MPKIPSEPKNAKYHIDRTTWEPVACWGGADCHGCEPFQTTFDSFKEAFNYEPAVRERRYRSMAVRPVEEDFEEVLNEWLEQDCDEEHGSSVTRQRSVDSA